MRVRVVLIAAVAAAHAPACAHAYAPHTRVGATRTSMSVRGARVVRATAGDETDVTVTVRKPTPSAQPPAAADTGVGDAEVKVTVRKPAAVSPTQEFENVLNSPDDTDATVTVRKPEQGVVSAVDVGGTPEQQLVEAARTSNIRDIKKALERGADANAADSQGYPALHLCAATGLAPGVVLLAKSGASLDFRANNLTAVTMAIGYNKPFTLETLIKCGASITEPDPDGLTPPEFIDQLRQKELDENAEGEENFFVKKVNKRLDALDQMKEALTLSGPDGKLAEADAQSNVAEMYAELAELLKWD